jgi:hypothetical protein
VARPAAANASHTSARSSGGRSETITPSMPASRHRARSVRRRRRAPGSRRS